jgi:EAL domain-containing protein (putative c-di-GMP-specific phosphodiesterase class I)/GGDEF domain-containing protein
MIYHFEFDIAAVFVTLFIMYYIIFKKGLSRHANRVYLVLVLLIFLAEISDIFGSVANNHPEFTTKFFQDFWNYTYLSAHNLMAYAFAIYLFFVLGYEKRHQKIMWAITVPIFVDLFLFVINPLTGLTFYYDEKGAYTHGPLFPIIYSVALFYMVFVIIYMIRHRKRLGKSKTKALIFFIVISFLPIVSQIIFPQYLLSLFFETLGLMGVLFTIENKDDIINPTTGIYNRFAFQSAIESAMSGKGGLLILVKIPNLNYYNKLIGFENMNGILRKVSRWMEEEFKNRRCYDCGRGHFAVLLEETTQPMLEKFKKDTLERFEKPWGKGKFSLSFPVQFGTVLLPDEVVTLENLFMLVDTPFEGKESSVLDAKESISAYERRVLIEHLIDKALKNKGFQVYYQPIWDSKTGKVRSAEALCRLIDNEYGSIAPDEFIPIAEQSGSIMEIGRIVFEEVCRFYKEGRLHELGIEYVEVNLSVVQCMSSDLKKTFEEILNRYGMDAQYINLEITESATAGNRRALVETIETLAILGFSFSLDDYGTGYSNISYMYEMPFSIIKIDKSILWKAMDPKTGERYRNGEIYLENTIRMLQDMNYSVLVEGVETLEQKMLLESMECNYFQGFYFSKPIRKEVFADYLKVVNA